MTLRPSFSSETGAQLLQRLQGRQLLGHLDTTLFPGGLKPSVAVEVYGEAGVGKTEVLLHLIVNSILPPTWQGLTIGGLGVGAIYMDTDHHFTLVRLIRILEARLDTAFGSNAAVMIEDMKQEFVTSCLKRLYLVRCTDSEQMIVTLHAVEQLVARKHEFSLLVIDSVSAFYWQDRLTHQTITQLDAYYRHLANILRKLMNECKMTVLFSRQHLINFKPDSSASHRQASSHLDGPFDSGERYFLGASMRKVPSWCINLSRTKDDSTGVVVAQVRGGGRSSTFRFHITPSGIQFVAPTDP